MAATVVCSPRQTARPLPLNTCRLDRWIVESFLPLFLLDKAQGQRAKSTGLLLNVLDKTDADVYLRVIAIEPVPMRYTQELRFVEPGTATDHASHM